MENKKITGTLSPGPKRTVHLIDTSFSFTIENSEKIRYEYDPATGKLKLETLAEPFKVWELGGESFKK